MSPLPLPEKPWNSIILWISEGACKGAVGFTGEILTNFFAYSRTSLRTSLRQKKRPNILMRLVCTNLIKFPSFEFPSFSPLGEKVPYN